MFNRDIVAIAQVILRREEPKVDKGSPPQLGHVRHCVERASKILKIENAHEENQAVDELLRRYHWIP